MAIAFDQRVDFGATPSALSVTPTAGGLNTLLVIMTVDATNATTVLVDGSAATKIGLVQRPGAGPFYGMFYFAGATAGSAHVVNSSQSFASNGGVYVYTGINQATPFDAFQSGTSTSSSLSLAFTASVANEWGVFFGSGNGSPVYSIGASRGIANQDAGDSNGSLGTGTQTQSITFTGTPNNAYIWAGFEPVATVATLNVRKTLLGVGI